LKHSIKAWSFFFQGRAKLKATTIMMVARLNNWQVDISQE